MATEIEHEGQVFILKSDVETIVRDRVGKVSTRATEWETKAKEALGKLGEVEGRATTADTLATQVQDLTTKLGQAEGKFGRYQAATQHGVSDAETIEALEWAHTKAMGGLAKKDQVDFGGWLEGAKADPTQAPTYLRHLFTPEQEGQSAAAPQPTQQPTGATQTAPTGQQPQPQWQSTMRGQQPSPPPPAGGMDVGTIRQADNMDAWEALYQQRNQDRSNT